MNRYIEYTLDKNSKNMKIVMRANLHDTHPSKIITSEKKFRNGGAPMFIIQNMNHQNLIKGKQLIAPFNIINLRDMNRSYIIITKQNNPDEHNP